MKGAYFLVVLLLGVSTGVYSQQKSPNERPAPDPKIAFLRSLALPGWGHHYVNSDRWTRGQYHLAAEATLILSYLGFRLHSDNLERNWHTYARSAAGVEIGGRSRMFQLAVGDFNTLQSYNEHQEQTRNWDRFIADTPQNQWSWDSDRDRLRYADLRVRFERIDRQLPALISLMVVNRVVSAVSAYNRARRMNEPSSTAGFHLSTYGAKGILANVSIPF